MRPLPLRVWKLRRMVVSTSTSWGFRTSSARRGDGVADVLGFFEEDGQQFGVEFFFAGLEQARGFGGEGRGGGRLGQRGGFGEELAGVEEVRAWRACFSSSRSAVRRRPGAGSRG
jgi:hypothetical protein